VSQEQRLRQFAADVRRLSVEMVARAKASHIGGALSMADILAALYAPGGSLRINPADPQWDQRDRFVLSKGHSCVALYASLALRGFFPVDELQEYARDGSRLLCHTSHHVPGVELSTGSLGHGLSFACGLALGARRRGWHWRSVAVLSDGELNEGSNWEAILFAGHHRLDNLWVVVDFNKIQSLGRVEEVLRLEPLAEKFESFGWRTLQIDGHSMEELREALDFDRAPPGRPTVVVADTVKGAGVDFMEDRLLWHYRSPDPAQLDTALAHLRAA
jgi:transketolase